jgi:hypothetical protein
MLSRSKQVLTGVILALSFAAPAVRAQGLTVEKIPLQHIDVRIVAAALGAMVLPTEDQIFFQRLQGGIGAYGAGLAPGTNSLQPATGASPFYGPSANWPGAGALPGTAPVYILADPGTNSLLVR